MKVIANVIAWCFALLFIASAIVSCGQAPPATPPPYNAPLQILEDPAHGVVCYSRHHTSLSCVKVQ